MIYHPRPYQARAQDFLVQRPRANLFMQMGLGKQQPNSEPVLTPTGWRAIGDLSPGDFVIGADGRPTEVLAVFPQGEQDVVEVEFTDGSRCRAGWDHLWRVFNATQYNKGQPGRVMSTREIVEYGVLRPNGKNGLKPYWYIPMAAPVEHPERDLPVDPYLLGVILGDGSIHRTGEVSLCTDLEILRSCGLNPRRAHKTCSYVWYASCPGVRQAMQDLSLAGKRSWEKHLPEEYLYASVAQRLAVLQGLLDTDGYPIPEGGAEFSSTSETLVDAVVELAQSLGGVGRKSAGRVTCSQTGPGRKSWRVNVKLRPEHDAFRLSRKLSKWRRPTKYPPVRRIAAVREVGREASTCIKVAASDCLYVTRSYVVTHNTSVALTVFDILRSFGEVKKMLVLGPVRVARTTWADEVQKWDHLRHLDVAVAAGATAAERRRMFASDMPIHTLNYENVPAMLNELESAWPYDIVITDESTRVKNHAAVRFMGKTKRKVERDGKLVVLPAEPGLKHVAGRTKRWINLSGAPTPKGLHDLWSQQYLLDGGKRLGKNITAFRNRWFTEGRHRGTYHPTPSAMEEITAAIQDCTLTLKSADYLDLPELITSRVEVDMPDSVRAFYQELEQEFIARIDDVEVLAANAAVLTGKLRQTTGGAIYGPDGKDWITLHDAKIDALASIVEEQAGAPLLVAYTFKHDLERLRAAFPFARHLDKDPKTVHDWNMGRIPMLLAHPGSAGPGLNLQDGGNAIAFFSPNWDLDGHDQIIERIGPTRQLQSGHPRPVFVYYITARDSIDELVLERLVERREVQDIFLERTK